jgi:hypothetical protein
MPSRCAIGDDPYVVDHGEEHLAQVLRLLLRARHAVELRDLREPVDEVGDLLAEVLLDRLERDGRVLDDVVQETCRDAGGVELEIREDVRDFEGVDEVGFARLSNLSPVLSRREEVGPPEEVDVGIRPVA